VLCPSRRSPRAGNPLDATACLEQVNSNIADGEVGGGLRNHMTATLNKRLVSGITVSDGGPRFNCRRVG
jgi:hypothetical protein